MGINDADKAHIAKLLAAKEGGHKVASAQRGALSEFNKNHGTKASMGEFKGGIKQTASKLGIKNPKFS